MSHAATNWAILQRGLKPTTKIVLWHLCDRYNPDFGCFPTQDRLAKDCEIGRATLNRHLEVLEDRRLIRRIRIIDSKTGQQRPTRYLLGFEFETSPSDPDQTGSLDMSTDCMSRRFDHPEMVLPVDATSHPHMSVKEASSANIPPCPETRLGSSSSDTNKTLVHDPEIASIPCLKTGQGPVSQSTQFPCLKNSPPRVSNRDTNPVREPLIKPVKEEEDARERNAVSDLFFGKLLEALGFPPNAARPGWWQGADARGHVRRWHDDLGLSEIEILRLARDSRFDHPAPPDGPKALDRIMARAASVKTTAHTQTPARGRTSLWGATSKSRGCKKTQSSLSVDPATLYAEWIHSDRYLPPSAISNSIRDQMLARGLVTVERLRERGIR